MCSFGMYWEDYVFLASDLFIGYEVEPREVADMGPILTYKNVNFIGFAYCVTL